MNDRGQVVGIVTSKLEESGGRPVEGIGFAIPINVVKDILPFLKAGAFSGGIPTPTPRPTATPRPTSTPRATFAPPTRTPGGGGPAAFGPTDGVLEHGDGSFIEEFDSGVLLADVVIEAYFFNPYSTSTGSWDYGFILRSDDAGAGTFHAVFVTSGGYWYHYIRKGTVESGEELASQWSSAIDTSAQGTNLVQVVALGDEGYLFINGSLASRLNLGGLAYKGDVSAINGYFIGNQVEGQTTRFEGFTVRSLRAAYGPTDGVLEHNPFEGTIKTHYAEVDIADAVIDAHFFNPYSTSVGSWTYGFILRNSATNTFHSVVVDSGGSWYHDVRTGSVESSETLAIQFSSGIDTAQDGSNYLRVIALGDDAWFFVNDIFMAKLEFKALTQPGDMSAATGFVTGDERVGESTRFSGFTVWSVGE